MPKKKTLIWTCLALNDRTELFYSHPHKDDAIFTDEISESLVFDETGGIPGRINGTREIIVSDNIVLIYDQTGKHIRILRILFHQSLVK